MTACLRCGQCCYLLNPLGEPTDRKCQWLIILNDGTTLCRMYLKRNSLLRAGWSMKINRGHQCVNRMDSPIDYEGCPYNRNDGRKVYKVRVR